MPSGFANYDSTSQFHTDVREAIHHYPLPPDTKTQQRSSQKSCLLTNSTPSGKWFKLHTLTVYRRGGNGYSNFTELWAANTFMLVKSLTTSIGRHRSLDYMMLMSTIASLCRSL